MLRSRPKASCPKRPLISNKVILEGSDDFRVHSQAQYEAACAEGVNRKYAQNYHRSCVFQSRTMLPQKQKIRHGYHFCQSGFDVRSLKC